MFFVLFLKFGDMINASAANLLIDKLLVVRDTNIVLASSLVMAIARTIAVVCNRRKNIYIQFSLAFFFLRFCR